MKHGRGRSQVRTIVATTSKKKAAEILNLSMGAFSQFWSETGNKTEIEVATKKPGIIFQSSSSSTGVQDFLEAV